MNADTHKDNGTPKGASVVIVGGGVTGLSAGWWLAREGIDVLVLEAGLIGWGASGRNGGGCSHHHSPLFLEEQRLWPMMDELLGYPTEFRAQRVRIALDENQLTLYRRALENGEHHGLRSDVLDAKQVRELVPLAGDNVYAGYFYHFGGHANPHRTLQAYAWALEDRGGRILQHTPVTDFVRQGGRVSAVKTPDGDFACDHLVIAAGPHTGVLAAQLGIDVPLAAARAEMIVTEPLAPMAIGGVDGNGLYGRQTLRGNLAYGGGPHEWIGLDDVLKVRPHSTPLQCSIAARLAALLPKAAHAKVIRSWAGYIENTPDGRPVIDRPDAHGNVTVATLSSVGFGLSPASGHAIRDLVVDGRCGFADLSSLTLGRFAQLEPDWRELQGWLPLPLRAPAPVLEAA
ncbi:FAD-binding oxidoreductase [Paraburkholderia sprentiae WSM5005]|uniref:FAD-binding oxidoreductase n=1 Tax=Paraburkholderia sprentiae WSM5005 TaxID=754502 RepID=A0A1I9YQU5_9BURK|nr:FAD-binding oxidoreductase [Paraburkholderia sprentiae]APA88586.1 FAD-binding oxidoreductase [Paraburkholderia sprentiae WSM5005]